MRLRIVIRGGKVDVIVVLHCVAPAALCLDDSGNVFIDRQDTLVGKAVVFFQVNRQLQSADIFVRNIGIVAVCFIMCDSADRFLFPEKDQAAGSIQNHKQEQKKKSG